MEITKISLIIKASEVWYEFSKDMWDMLHSEEFKRAFTRMGVELVFEYPFTLKKDDCNGEN